MLLQNSPEDRLVGCPIVDYRADLQLSEPTVIRIRSDAEGIQAMLDQIWASKIAGNVGGLIVVISGGRLGDRDLKQLAEREGISEEKAQNYSDRIIEHLVLNPSEVPQFRGIWIAAESDTSHHTSRVDFAEILNSYPGLQEVGVQFYRMEMSPFRHISLRRLSINVFQMYTGVLRSLQDSVAPELEELEFVLSFGAVANALQHLTADQFPKLHTLRIRGAWDHQKALERMHETGLLKQLRCLDFSSSSFGAEDAQALLEMAEHCPQLEKFVIRETSRGQTGENPNEAGDIKDLLRQLPFEVDSRPFPDAGNSRLRSSYFDSP